MAVTFVGLGAYASAIANTTTTLSVPARSGIAAGDLLFMRVAGVTLTANNVTYSAPAGWTALGLQSYNDPYVSGTRVEVAWFWKVADGTEGTQTVTLSSGPGSGAAIGGVMYAFRDARFDAGSPTAAVTAGTGSFTAPSMTGYVDGMAIVDAHKRGTAGTTTNAQGFNTSEGNGSGGFAWGSIGAAAIQGAIWTKSLTADGTVTFPTLQTGTFGPVIYMQAILLPTGAGWSIGRIAY